jgi:hypothetical protein
MERHPDSASSPGFRADPAHARTEPARTWLHVLVNVVVAIVVLAVAAGMFVFSYPGIHAIARQGGVSGQLARYYPALFDAVLVIACVAAVTLRDARWWARCWAWLVAIVILGAIGTTDVLHAMSYGLRQRPTEGVVAAAPVAAVLLAFSLFLTMLRQSRPRPSDAARGQAPARGPAGDGAAEPPTAPMMVSNVDVVPTPAARPPAPPIALPAAPTVASPVGAWAAGLFDDDADRAPDAPVTVAETPETVPTREVPAFAADASEAGRDPGTAGIAGTAGTAGTAGAVEEPAPAAPAVEAPDTAYPPTEPDEAVTRPPSTAAGPAPTQESAEEPTQEPAPESTPEPPAETTGPQAGQPADEATDEAPASQATDEAPTGQTTGAAPTGQTTGAAPADQTTGAAPADQTTGAAPADQTTDAAPTEPQPDRAPAPATQPIRYASSAAAEQFGDEDWEAEVDPALAGQVYPVLTSDPDIEVPPHEPGQSQDLEDDAPPFATAPFASVPRLNRVRVSPTPPTQDEDPDEE